MRPTPTGTERTFGEEDIIVSKTDRAGRLTYANDVFLRVAGYTEAEVLGQPHSMIRHPDMPRGVFELLWTVIAAGREVFAYVVNLARNGDHYWVFAHVTPTLGPAGDIVGYHSNRRLPTRAAVAKVQPLYARLLAAERACAGKPAQIAASTKLLGEVLAAAGMQYDEFVFTL